MKKSDLVCSHFCEKNRSELLGGKKNHIWVSSACNVNVALEETDLRTKSIFYNALRIRQTISAAIKPGKLWLYSMCLNRQAPRSGATLYEFEDFFTLACSDFTQKEIPGHYNLNVIECNGNLFCQL